MPGREDVERLLHEAYAARVSGDLEAIGRIFGEDARFRMAGSPNASAIAVDTHGANEYRPLISQMIKTFELSDFSILSMTIEESKAAVHWRAKVRSTVTGDVVETELMDVIEVKDGRIASFTEFCDTALAARLMSPQLRAASA